jgi:hypothetical protein
LLLVPRSVNCTQAGLIHSKLMRGRLLFRHGRGPTTRGDKPPSAPPEECRHNVCWLPRRRLVGTPAVCFRFGRASVTRWKSQSDRFGSRLTPPGQRGVRASDPIAIRIRVVKPAPSEANVGGHSA